MTATRPVEAGRGGARAAVVRLVEAPAFQHAITVIIILNAVALGLDTYPAMPAAWHAAFAAFDVMVTGVFVVELSLKLFAWRWSFFRNGWNVFDFVVVAVALIPAAGSGFAIVRALRVLRVLRLISLVPKMRKVVEALLRAVPGMGAIIAVLGLITYVGAVMATNLYGETSPEMFGTLERSAFTLFQVMTMDGWRGEVVQPVMDAGHPFSWVFFLTFILVGSFAILNLFIALIVDAMNDEVEEGIEKVEASQASLRAGQIEASEERAELVTLLAQMRAEMAELKAAVAAPRPPAP
jgi:voltage-gated sodium channel